MADTGIYRLPAASRDLRWWSEQEWSGGIECTLLTGLEQFAIRTRNTLYELTVLSPVTGEVLVRGGRFFPDHTRALFTGSSLGGSFLKVRTIHPGFLMEFHHEGQRIVTTRVKDVTAIAARSA